MKALKKEVGSESRARTFKCLWGPGIDSKEWIPPAYVAWRAGTITLFLAPIGCLKIPALLKDLTIMEITKYLKNL